MLELVSYERWKWMGGMCNDSKIDLFMVILGNWNWRVGDENKVEINNLYNEFHLVIVSRRGGEG